MAGIRVTEIVKVSEQGVNHPFLCRADDGYIYWCKGLQAGFRVLISEWIAGGIAKNMRLPLPEFKPLICDPELSEAWARDARSGGRFCERLSSVNMNVVFGSKGVPAALDVRNAEDVDEISSLRLRASVYLFDRVVQNSDRTAGNSNVLMRTGVKNGLYIIDHSNALAVDFNLEEFSRTHIFHDSWSSCNEELRRDLIENAKRYVTRQSITEAWNSMPDEWKDESVPDGMNLGTIEQLIRRNLETL